MEEQHVLAKVRRCAHGPQYHGVNQLVPRVGVHLAEARGDVSEVRVDAALNEGGIVRARAAHEREPEPPEMQLEVELAVVAQLVRLDQGVQDLLADQACGDPDEGASVDVVGAADVAVVVKGCRPCVLGLDDVDDIVAAWGHALSTVYWTLRAKSDYLAGLSEGAGNFSKVAAG